MKIAFDLHGTLDTHQRIRELYETMRQQNPDLICILSGPPKKQIIEECGNLGINIDNVKILSIHDWLLECNRVFPSIFDIEFDDRGKIWTDDETWWSSKFRIMVESGYNILIDDKEEYSDYFNSNFAFLKV